MRKFLWAIPIALLFGSIGTPRAHAGTGPVGDSCTDYRVNFTVSTGGPTPTGSFVFDSTTDLFPSYTVDWNGVVYSFVDVADAIGLPAVTAPGVWCAAGPSGSVACANMARAFNIDEGNIEFPISGTFTSLAAVAGGSYTVTESSATPEPSSLILFGTSLLGLVPFRRKLFGR